VGRGQPQGAAAVGGFDDDGEAHAVLDGAEDVGGADLAEKGLGE